MTNNTEPLYTAKTLFIRASEVSEVMDVSRAYAYRVIKQLNEELNAKGYIVVNGRTSRKYFFERIYGNIPA